MSYNCNETSIFAEIYKNVFNGDYHNNETIELDPDLNIQLTSISLRMISPIQPIINCENVTKITFNNITFDIFFTLNITQTFTGYASLPKTDKPSMIISFPNNYAYINYASLGFTQRKDNSFKLSKKSFSKTNTSCYKFSEIENFKFFNNITNPLYSFPKLTNKFDYIIYKHIDNILWDNPMSNTRLLMKQVINEIENNGMFRVDDCQNGNHNSMIKQLQITTITYDNIERVKGDDSSTLRFNDISMSAQYNVDDISKVFTVKYDYVQLSLGSQTFIFGTINEGAALEIQTTCIFNKVLQKHISN